MSLLQQIKSRYPKWTAPTKFLFWCGAVGPVLALFLALLGFAYNYYLSSQMGTKLDDLQAKVDRMNDRFDPSTVVFGVTDYGIVVPTSKPLLEGFKIDWGAARVESVSASEITIRTPTVESPLGNVIENCFFTFGKAVGYSYRPFSHSDYTVEYRVLSVEDDYALIGAKIISFL